MHGCKSSYLHPVGSRETIDQMIPMPSFLNWYKKIISLHRRESTAVGHTLNFLSPYFLYQNLLSKQFTNHHYLSPICLCLYLVKHLSEASHSIMNSMKSFCGFLLLGMPNPQLHLPSSVVNDPPHFQVFLHTLLFICPQHFFSSPNILITFSWVLTTICVYCLVLFL